MGVSETHPLVSHPVQVGSGNFRIGVVAAYVAVPQIVGKDDHHIG